MEKLGSHKRNSYRPFSNDSLITQVLLLNLVDALLTLYATKVGVGEMNPFMRLALKVGPIIFISIKVFLVTTCMIVLNRVLGHSGRRLYLFLASSYWLVLVWHCFGLAVVLGVDPT